MMITLIQEIKHFTLFLGENILPIRLIETHVIIKCLFGIDYCYWFILLKNKLDKTYKIDICGRQIGILTLK